MMGLLYAKKIQINEKISIMIPLVGEVIDSEESYFDIVSLIIATPYDMMAQLDNANIDFTEISEFELFCLLFPMLKDMDTSLVFGELDLSKLRAMRNTNTGEVVLRDDENDIVIDRVIHSQICSTIRKMLRLQHSSKRPGNEEAKKYLLERERKRLKRKNKKKVSQFESSIIALVNTEQFSYTYESVRDITIYQFYSSLDQIAHKIKYDNVMGGYYAGTVNFDDLAPEDKTWIQNIQ